VGKKLAGVIEKLILKELRVIIQQMLRKLLYFMFYNSPKSIILRERGIPVSRDKMGFPI